MRNTSGLRPFPKGVSGNPSGRPKKRPISDQYAALLSEVVPPNLCKRFKLQKGITFGEAIALRTGVMALKASAHTFAKEMREAIEGKAPQRIELATPEDGEIVLKVVYENNGKNGSH